MDLRTAIIALGDAAPDLVVGRPRISPREAYFLPRQPFDLSVTIRNRGTAPAYALVLRYYYSVNSTITTSDNLIAVDDSLPALPAGRTIEATVGLIAQGYASTFFLGACIDPVRRESDTNNNCSPGVPLTVRVR